MKKFLSLVIALTFGMFLFAGCTHQAGTAVTGIAFKSTNYYVDLGVPTKLDYKILPNTAKSFNPEFRLVGNEVEEIRKVSFDRDTGYITVNDSTFTKIEVEIHYGSFVDKCEVELKKYPSTIDVADENVYISSNGITQIPYYGLFGSEWSIMDTAYYKTVVTSSDETVITVESQQNVVVKSTGKQGGATITIEVVASDGSKIGNGLKTNVNVEVTNNVTNCALLTSYENNESITISEIYRDVKTNTTEFIFDSTVKDYTYKIEPVLLDGEGYVVENVGYTILPLNENIINVVDNGDGTFNLVAVGSGTTQILITSHGYGSNGEVVIFKISCNVNISS